MARYIGPVCKLCRREGVKLYIKGERCYSDKCAVEKRKTAPGQHGARRSKLSDYGIQLREKQKLRRIYGVLEKQFRKTLFNASRKRGKTGDLLLFLLETRLDSVIHKLGLAPNKSFSRQLVRHNHFIVNGTRVNIPSYNVKVGDKITLVETSRQIPGILSALEITKRAGHEVPAWLKWDPSNFTGEIISKPQREDISIPVKEQLIVELYSK